MRLKLFENFEKATILDNTFIIKSKGRYLIPRADFKCFSMECLKGNQLSYLNYASLMRFYLYVWLLKYNGNDEWTKYIIGVLKNTDDPSYDKVCRILNQIGNNNAVLKYIKSKTGIYIKNNKDTNIETLTQMDQMKNKIFNDMNFREITTIISELTKKADDSEKKVLYFLKKIWGKYFKIKEPLEEEDIDGVDLWRINIETGDRDGLQVKNISKGVDVNVSGNTIAIKPTGIDLKKYDSFKDDLKYDYLILYDKFRKKMYLINGKAIYKIIKYDSMVLIVLKKWDAKYNAVKTYDLPAKFT